MPAAFLTRNARDYRYMTSNAMTRNKADYGLTSNAGDYACMTSNAGDYRCMTSNEGVYEFMTSNAGDYG